MRYIKKAFNYFALLKYDIIGMKWPSSEEMFKNLLIVLSVSIGLGLYIFGLDSISVFLYRNLL